MIYVSVSARFLLFDGKTRYTIEYCYGLAKWFIFNDIQTSNSIYSKSDRETRYQNINSYSAENVLNEYLQTL